MTDVIVYTTKNRSEADQFIANRKAFNENVYEISDIDVVDLVKNDEMQQPWASGFNHDWIFIVSSPSIFINK